MEELEEPVGLHAAGEEDALQRILKLQVAMDNAGSEGEMMGRQVALREVEPCDNNASATMPPQQSPLPSTTLAKATPGDQQAKLTAIS